MRIIHGIKFGGLQQKIFNLILLFVLILIGVYTGVSLYQQKNLSDEVNEASDRQQESITQVSEETMEAVLDASMTRSTALQAYMADDLFSDVRSDVLTLREFASQLYEHRDSFPAHPVALPDPSKDGIPTVQMQSEKGVDPAASEDLGLVANMSEIMLAMFESSDKLSSCFVATADGCILFADDRSGSYVTADGEVDPYFDVRQRPWYIQAEEAGDVIFTGVEEDAFTGIQGLVCAAPVIVDNDLVAVVGADIFLTSMSDYVSETSTEESFVCVVNGNGKVLFSPQTEGVFAVGLSSESEDLRKNENTEIASFVTDALKENTGLRLITVDDKEYYVAGSPLSTVGWTVLSITEKEVTHQPTAQMLGRYDEINNEALNKYAEGAKNTQRTTIILTIAIILLALIGALVVAQRIVKPIETMTSRINALRGEDAVFVMDKAYKTGDEIEILAESFASLSKRTVDYIEEVTAITAEKERIGTELSLATRIQANMLPSIYPAFPERPEFDIYATMTPAKEVGGDFYDFFLTDDDHLCMVMADVSGKGVPAALFMMASKIILANHAMLGKSPAKILEDTNAAICANNREEMFVTVWLGILELSTGRLVAANAGHEYPVVKQEGESFELYKDKHGFVIGGMAGMRYTDYEIVLNPGAKLFVYTDGVPEATNADDELFGTDRMLDALNNDLSAKPEQMLDNVRNAVDGFVGGAEQFDDLTMLGMVYLGDKNNSQDEDLSVEDVKSDNNKSDNNKNDIRAELEEIEIDALTENLPQVLDFIDSRLEAAGCSMKSQTQIDIAVEEIFVNIAHYAYGDLVGKAKIGISIEGEPKVATIRLSDFGAPYNPLEKEDPDVHLSAEERQIGGLGIFMTKKVMDEVTYEYIDGQNILTMKKNI